MLKNYQETLEYAFDVLNRVYFNGELPPIVICIMSSRRTYGHYTVNKEWRLEAERLHEINIGLGGDDGTANKPKSSTRKYVCPCCGNSFRATKDISVLCMDCGEQFVKVEK